MLTPLQHFSVIDTPVGVTVFKHEFLGGKLNQIAPGVPVDVNEVADFFRELGGARGGFIPLNVLYQGTGLVAWFVPGKVRTLHFRPSNGAGIDLTIPLPNMVMASNGRSIWAVAVADENPTPDSQIHHAPLFNFYKNGSMCLGSVKLPKGELISSLDDYESCVFDSYFTHTNHEHLIAGESRDNSDCIKRFSQLKGQSKYPNDWLVSKKMTLSQWINSEVLGNG